MQQQVVAPGKFYRENKLYNLLLQTALQNCQICMYGYDWINLVNWLDGTFVIMVHFSPKSSKWAPNTITVKQLLHWTSKGWEILAKLWEVPATKQYKCTEYGCVHVVVTAYLEKLKQEQLIRWSISHLVHFLTCHIVSHLHRSNYHSRSQQHKTRQTNSPGW